MIKKIAIREGWNEDAIDRGLVINDKDRRKLSNRYDYEAHKRERVNKQKEKNHTIVPCPLCLQPYKYSSLTKHKNNRNCKKIQAIIKEMNKDSR